MVSSITCIAQNSRIYKSQDQSLTTQFQIFTKENVFFFPLENRNVPIFWGSETQKSGQFWLLVNREGWQVSYTTVKNDI